MQGELEGIQLARDRNPFTHHQFINDNILIGQAKESEARKFKQFLSHYERDFHEKVYLQNNKLFVLNSSAKKKKKLAIIIGCQEDDIPSKYLGIPLFHWKEIKAIYWDNLVEKIKSKLSSQKNKTLNYDGRFTLIKHTLQSMPIYLVLVFKIPTIENKIDKLCK